MSLAPLTISADKLTFLESGKPWVQRGTLSWPIYGRHLRHGSDYARTFFRDRKSVGANTVACAGMLGWADLGFGPHTPGYWDQLHPFCDIAEQEGIRLQWVVFCDTKQLMPDQATRLAHWERFLVHLGARTNTTFVVANQPGHPTQAIRPEQTVEFHKPFPHQLIARNNPFEGHNPVVPCADFSLYCSSRSELGDGYRGWALSGTDLWYIVNGWPEAPHEWGGTHQVSVLFERYRVELNTLWADPAKARWGARCLTAKGTGGGNHYSREDRDAVPYTGVTRACAVEFLGNIPTP